jgi:hypothetical protein
MERSPSHGSTIASALSAKSSAADTASEFEYEQGWPKSMQANPTEVFQGLEMTQEQIRHTHTHAHVHARSPARMHIRTPMRTHTCVHRCTRKHTKVHARAHVYSHVCVCTHEPQHACKCTCTCTLYTHARTIHVSKHTHTHAHVHTSMRNSQHVCKCIGTYYAHARTCIFCTQNMCIHQWGNMMRWGKKRMLCLWLKICECKCVPLCLVGFWPLWASIAPDLLIFGY